MKHISCKPVGRLASFPGSPLAPTKIYFSSERGESLGTRQVTQNRELTCSSCLCGVSMAALVLVAGLRGVSMAALVLVADLRGVAKAMAPALVAYEFLFPHGVPSRRFKSHSVLWDVKIKGSDIYS